MQKWSAALFVLAVAGFVAAVFVARPSPPGPKPVASAGAVAGASDAGSDAAVTPVTSATLADAAPPSDAGEPTAATGDEGSGAPESPFQMPDAGRTLMDGTAPPSLAAEAPRSVVFGVILVQYKGAQAALPGARSRDAALELAKQLAADAKQDFKAAVAKGDKGSIENAGRMPRGMLEPAPEYVLFSLPKDGVSDPVDTPRGFWIVHRIE